ncbi:MAG: hypothetical protein ACOZAM_15500 [Pseudomonadota bacterium]
MAENFRLSRIDASNIGDHWYLQETDECYYLFEYTSHKNFSFSQTNNLISNLKKKPGGANRPGYHYKGRAIQECAQHLAATIDPAWLQTSTLVPVPSSKARGHPDFDDRIARICRSIRPVPPLDVRELVRQTQSLVAAHEVGDGQRPKPQDIRAVYEIDETLTNPVPLRIGIFDDVLTNGTHYRAMHAILSERFPGVPIVGIFIARRVLPNTFESEPA